MNKNTQLAWLNSLRSEIDFYSENWRRKRAGNDFPWALVHARSNPVTQTLRSLGRNIRESLGLRKTHSTEWLTDNAEALHEARCLFHDDLSRSIFDNTLILRTVGFENTISKNPISTDLPKLSKTRNSSGRDIREITWKCRSEAQHSASQDPSAAAKNVYWWRQGSSSKCLTDSSNI